MRLLPRDPKFFDLLADLSGHLTEGAKLLRSILADPSDLAMRVSQVQAIEHKADKATHAIITKLNQTFITPFDREDIHRLASSLDDVLDFVNSAALRLVMYKISAPPQFPPSWLGSSCCSVKASLPPFPCWRKTGK